MKIFRLRRAITPVHLNSPPNIVRRLQPDQNCGRTIFSPPQANFFWVVQGTRVSVITIMKKLTQRGGKQKSSVENEFVVFRLLLASDWRKRVDYIHSSTKSWILEQFWCDIFTRKSLLKQIVDDVFCRFWKDFQFYEEYFPQKIENLFPNAFSAQWRNVFLLNLILQSSLCL